MNKRILLALRFVLILTTVLVMTYSQKGLDFFAPGYTLALIYLLSNLSLYFIPKKILAKPVASFAVFMFDIVIISFAIYLTEGIYSDFYLIYFLAIFVAAIGQGVAGSIPVVIVASAIYIWMLFKADPGISLIDSRILIRIPFLFILAIMGSYWSQSTRRELKKKDELERFNRELKKEVERVAAKEIELRQYSQKIIDSVPSGVIAVRNDGTITTLNPEAERVLGVKLADVSHINIQDIERLKPLWQKMSQSVFSDNLMEREEIAIKNVNNKTIPVGLSTSPLTGADESNIGCVAIFKDVSQIRALESKLKHAERLSYLGKMASWVAHEIRNPLTVIDGFAQLLGNTHNVEKIQRFSVEIRKGTQRINYIIDDILAFARTKKKVAYTKINLREVIESITNSLKNIETTINGHENPVVTGQIESIRRLFINLINNSAEEMTENAKLHITFSINDTHCITEIVDNGPGIREEDMKNLFTPFFTTKERGTGLGLSIVKKIVDEHGGTIEIRSQVGIGTAVTVVLSKERNESETTDNW